MKIKGILVAVFCFCASFAFGQNVFPANGNVTLQNTGYQGFFVKSTGGSAQFRFRAAAGAFIFDDANNNQKAQIGFHSPSSSLLFLNQANGPIYFRAGANLEHYLQWTNDGKLGVGTNNPGETLSVNGKMECEEAQVVQDVADYVFAEDYNMMSLEEIEQYIKENKHLPNIQTQEDVDNNKGRVKLGELSVSLMAKVEELTLHLIAINKEVKNLKQENELLKKEINK